MTIQYRTFIFLFWGMLAGGMLVAQPALHLRHLTHEISSQAYQPAYLAMQSDSALIRVGGGLGYGAGSNVLSMDQLYLEAGFLSDATKDDIIGQLKTDNRIQLGFLWDVTVNVQLKKLPISVFTRQNTQTFVGFNDPRSLGLLLYGNAKYAGETLTDEGISFGLSRYQEIGAGTALSAGKWAVGIRLKALLGQQATVLQNLDYSLFTEAFGAKVSMQSEYNFFRTQNTGNPGIGFGIDLGAVYTLRPNLSLQFAVQDLGSIRWQGDSYEQTVNFDYEGIEITQLFSTDFTNPSSFIPSDTLRSLLIPDPASGQLTQQLPTQLSIGGAYSWNQSNQLFTTILIGLSDQTYSKPSPLVNLAYHRKLGNFFTLGLNAYGGGLDQYGFGLLARTHISFADKMNLSIFGTMDNAMGLLSPVNGRGLSFQAGLTASLK
ncbi:MAG: DUF5723 family protein [Bacteroidota bacterium]